MEANAEIFKRATKELQRLKNAKFDLFSDEVSSMNEWHDEDHFFHDHEPEETTISPELLGWIVRDLQESFQTNEYKQPPALPTTTEPIILNLPESPTNWWSKAPHLNFKHWPHS